MKLDTCNTALEPVSAAYFIKPSHRRVFVCVSLLVLLVIGSVYCIPLFIAKQRLGKHVPAATNTGKIIRIVGHACLCVRLCIPPSSLGNNSVKICWRRRFLRSPCCIRKESRYLILFRTSCSSVHNIYKQASPTSQTHSILHKISLKCREAGLEILGRIAVYLGYIQMFQRKISPPSSDSKSKLNSSVCVCLQPLVPLVGENIKLFFLETN
jgi:hypothetical protein